MLSRTRFFFEQATRNLIRAPMLASITVVTIAIALGLLATFAIVVQNLDRVMDRIGREVGVSVYMKTTASSTTSRTVATSILALPHVEHATVVTSSQALAELRKALGNGANVLDGLPDDVLPPFVEVSLKPVSYRPRELFDLAESIRRFDGVLDVRYGQEEIERVHALVRFLRASSGVVAIVLCIAVVLLVFNTIRLTIYAKKDEIEILDMLGATDVFIRAPYIIEGAIKGAMGAGLAALFLFASQSFVQDTVETGLAAVLQGAEFHFVSSQFLALTVVLGLALGLVGSLIAIGRVSRL